VHRALYVATLQLPPNDHLPNSINAVDLKDRLRDIETDCRDRSHEIAPVKCKNCDFKRICPMIPQEFRNDDRPPPISVPGGTKMIAAFDYFDLNFRKE
jgi:hypothetical protein